jgi:hypothetical protein
MAILQEKQEEEKIRLQQMFEKNMQEQRDQLTNMMQANFDEQKQEREAALARQKTMDDMVGVMKQSLDKRDEEITLLRNQIQAIANRPQPKTGGGCAIV